MSVLEARDIAFGYGRANVWEHVSLALEAGEGDASGRGERRGQVNAAALPRGMGAPAHR